MNISSDPKAWIAAILILCLYSFLYKENPVFRFAEHLYIGIGAGHAVAVQWNNLKNTAWLPLIKGNLLMIIPIAIGILLYTRFSKRWAHVSRLCLALPVGLGIGLALRGLPAAQILSQIRATLVPLDNINNFLLVIGVMGTLSFFFFTTRRTVVTNVFSEIGKWTMMITFGLTFATAVFGQMAVYLGALQRVLGNWLGMIR
jgi:hypothetical protein